MRTMRIPFAMLAMLLAVTWLAVGCSDDDDPTDPGSGTTDTTAPEVVSFSPSNDDSNVPRDEELTITFSEAMDADSATDGIVLSNGTVTGLTWTDTRTLVVGHTAWDEAAQVTVTVGTGLTDAAGNAMNAAQSATFYVMSTTLSFQASVPADGAVDVNRSAVITMLFTGRMNLTRMETSASIRDSGNTEYPFTVAAGDEDWVILDPTGDLPAGEDITVSVSTDAEDDSGRQLDQEVVVTFTTGQDIDTVPPTIVSWSPDDGATVDPSTTFLRVTFSEPMNIDTVEPVRVNAEFAVLLREQDSDVLWTENNTVMTVPLPALPAGLPMDVTFQDFADANGVVQSEAAHWSATVAGVADYYPLVDGRIYEYGTIEVSGDIGSPDPTWSGAGEEHIRYEAQAGGVYHRKRYDAGFETSADWDVMQKGSGALEYLGFHETDEGQPLDIVFDTPLTFLALPPAGDWSAATTATVADMGVVSLEGTGTFVEETDLEWAPAGPGEAAMFWKNVRLVVIEHRLFQGDDTFETGVDSLWLAPTVGIVEIASYSEYLDEGTWDHDHGVLIAPQSR